jgi:ubiquinol-cytochrome c reductase cytochrome b subunit
MEEKRLGLFSKIKERVGWNTILEHKVPKHSNDFGYCLGGITLSAIVVLAVTGVILAQFYHPAPEEAYATVNFIITRVAGGAFIRNVHFWAAQFATAIVGLHMIRVLVAGAYKKPREIQWLVGVGLLFLVGAFMFTGTALKWDQEAVEGLGHNVELAEGLGALGIWFLPQFAQDVPLLTRLFVAHVSILPVIGLIFLGAHFLLIRVLGISTPVNGTSRDVEMVPFSEHVKRVLGYGAVLTGVLLVLAGIASAPLGPQMVGGFGVSWQRAWGEVQKYIAAPLGSKAVEGVEVSKPPWFVLWVYGIENLWGLRAVPFATAAIAIVLMIVPFLDRVRSTDPTRRKLILGLVFVGYIIIFALTAYAALRPPQTHLMG